VQRTWACVTAWSTTAVLWLRQSLDSHFRAAAGCCARCTRSPERPRPCGGLPRRLTNTRHHRLLCIGPAAPSPPLALPRAAAGSCAPAPRTVPGRALGYVNTSPTARTTAYFAVSGVASPPAAELLLGGGGADSLFPRSRRSLRLMVTRVLAVRGWPARRVVGSAHHGPGGRKPPRAGDCCGCGCSGSGASLSRGRVDVWRLERCNSLSDDLTTEYWQEASWSKVAKADPKHASVCGVGRSHV